MLRACFTEYRLRACRSHTLLPLPRLLRQTLSARANFCARVNDLGVTAFDGETMTLPTPLNVALGAGPKISGCGDGAALHESPDVHGGGDTGTGLHGTTALHA
jgi:hypothetical protein